MAGGATLLVVPALLRSLDERDGLRGGIANTLRRGAGRPGRRSKAKNSQQDSQVHDYSIMFLDPIGSEACIDSLKRFLL